MTDTARVEDLSNRIGTATAEIAKVIVGQTDVVEQLLIALFARGHCLLVGVPGLAKTLLIRTVADSMDLTFSRVQFTPDLMPGDITGTEVIEENRTTGQKAFRFIKGPIFANIVLADEINRTPPKTQAALLEAMQEYSVTASGTTYRLEEPFFVLATQNPIEQEGTYPLPEAQLDRFLMHVRVDYPTIESERKILHLVRNQARNIATPLPARVSQTTLFAARQEVLNIHMAPAVEEYILQLVMATRHPERYSKELASWIDFGASPRGTIALDLCSRAHAWLKGNDFVSPEDVHEVVRDVLRHRVLLSFEAEAAGVDPDKVLGVLLELVPTA